MSTEQIAVRLPEALLDRLDRLVARGVYASRAAAVRAGAELIVDLDRRREIDDAVIEGYQRVPPTAVESETALESLREAIAEERW